jgi:hypothetical protein
MFDFESFDIEILADRWEEEQRILEELVKEEEDTQK